MSEKTCAERIQDQLQQRNEMLEEIYDKLSSDERDDKEEAYEELYNLPLSIDTFKLIKIHLSTGGPGDWIEATLKENGYVEKMYYHFHDWFDHASIPVDENSYMWQFATEVIDGL